MVINIKIKKHFIILSLIILSNLKLTLFYSGTNVGINSIVDVYKCAEHGLSGNKRLGSVSYLNSTGVYKYDNYLSKCKNGQYCQSVSYANEDIGFCTPIIHQGRPGEKCKSDGDCYSFNCTKNKCVGKKEGSLCLSSLECDTNYFCVYENFLKSDDNDPKYCTQLVGSGETCMFGSPPIQRKDTYYSTMFNFNKERDDNCPPGYICTIASGSLSSFKSRLAINDYRCISKFSVLTGQYVGYEQYIACETGYMTLHIDTDNVPYGQCRSIQSDGICDSDGRCIADGEGNVVDCMYDVTGELFCPVVGMTDRIKNYTKIFNHAIATAGIDFDIVWGKETTDKEEVRMAYLYLKYYHWFRNADECQISYMKYINNGIWIKASFWIIISFSLIILN